jgi:hypothetical protein
MNGAPDANGISTRSRNWPDSRKSNYGTLMQDGWCRSAPDQSMRVMPFSGFGGVDDKCIVSGSEG